jgi:hypothetical protein
VPVRALLRRRSLPWLVIVVAVLLVIGADALLARHFGTRAAAGRAPYNYLNAIACPTARQCWAVGQRGSVPDEDTFGDSRHQLLEHEAGGRWHFVRAPQPYSADPALEDITCPDASDCWAVGGSAVGGPAIIDHWAGGAWRLAAAPVLSGAQLDSVSCASPRQCWAVGGREDRASQLYDVLEYWDGIRWSLQQSLPGGLQPRQLACAPAGYCLAVGQRDGAAAAAEFSGGRWTPISLPAGRPTGKVPSLLGCASRALCLAVFQSQNAMTSAASVPVVTEQWDGHAWTPRPGALPPDLADLTCAGPRGCWLLGATRGSRPLALHWQQPRQGRPGHWAPVAAASPQPSGYLTGLGCGRVCWAVGATGSLRGNGVFYSQPLITELRAAGTAAS